MISDKTFHKKINWFLTKLRKEKPSSQLQSIVNVEKRNRYGFGLFMHFLTKSWNNTNLT